MLQYARTVGRIILFATRFISSCMEMNISQKITDDSKRQDITMTTESSKDSRIKDDER